jgi:hypothetical protein
MKFHGKVGYGKTVETSPGVREEVIEEREYSGDVTRASRMLSQGEAVNPDLSLSNAVSIVSDAFAMRHYFKIRYVEWAGVRWSVSNVEIQRPRLILSFGEVYNGPTPTAPESP